MLKNGPCGYHCFATPGSSGSPWGTPALNDIARVPAPYLRKNFSVGQTVTRAMVYVTALGAYGASIGWLHGRHSVRKFELMIAFAIGAAPGIGLQWVLQKILRGR